MGLKEEVTEAINAGYAESMKGLSERFYTDSSVMKTEEARRATAKEMLQRMVNTYACRQTALELLEGSLNK